MKRLRPSFYPLFLSLLFLLQGCIGDNTSDCNPVNRDIRIYFNINIEGYAPALSAADIDRMNLFVFDQTGTFVGEWIDENPAIGPDYYMTIQLDPGQYSFVTWAGLRTDYTLTPYPLLADVTAITDATLSFNRPANGQILTAPDPLFFARLDGCQINNGTETFTLALQQNIYTINITTKGITPSTDTYKLDIKDDNGVYNFDNSFAPSPEYNYITACTNDALNQPMGSLSVLRLAENRTHPVLKLTNEVTSEVLYQTNLIELILKLRELGQVVDFDTMHDFDIQLEFGDANLNVGVSINGWVVIETNSEM